MAGLWKTVTKSVVAETTYSTSGLNAASFISVWLHKVLLKLQLCGVYTQALKDKLVIKTGSISGPVRWKIQFALVELFSVFV